MKRYRLHREQIIGRPREEVFSFFEKPENLARITPPSMGFKIITPSPIHMAPGALIDYTIRIFGIRRRWTTRITEYNPPYAFVDEQMRGPYSFWRHTHHFEEIPDGTRVVDTVEYVVPFGIFGRLIHALFVKWQLDRIFNYRAQRIKSIFGHEHSFQSGQAHEKG